jgi:short-subunit dehydrogenase
MTTVITGASSGLGAAYADRLARRGEDVVLVARRAEALAEVAERIAEETGRAAEVLALDLGDPADVAALEGRIRDDREITGLVNNAGYHRTGTAAEIGSAEHDAMIALNVTALTRLSAAAAGAFAERGGGTIVNVGSVMALYQSAGFATYSATKAYVLAFGEGLRQEVADRGVRVHTVLPGALRTGFWAASGIDIATLPDEIVMTVDDAVDAALAGLDAGEDVTIPGLADVAGWHEYEAQRLALVPQLSQRQPADRYAAVG